MNALLRETARKFASLAVTICLLFVVAAGQSPPAPKVTAVRAARMIDVRAGNVVENAVVLVENGRIKAAGAGVAIPAGAEVIDLGNATLLPGLIDAHTHLLQNYDKNIGGE